MLKHLGRLKIPGYLTGRKIAESEWYDPISTLPRNDANTRGHGEVDVIWCYDVEPHTDDDNYNVTTLVVLDSNQHTLHVEGHGSLLLTRGDAVAFRSDITHSLTRPNNRRVLFCALFIDSENRNAKFDMDRAKKMLDAITQ